MSDKPLRWVNEGLWGIVGVHGLYLGLYFTRREAISDHTVAKGRNWRSCRRRGDRAVRVTVEWEVPRV